MRIGIGHGIYEILTRIQRVVLVLCTLGHPIRNKSAGSWKISLAIPTTQTIQTREYGHSRTWMRRETRRRRFSFCRYLISRFFGFVDIVSLIAIFFSHTDDHESCTFAPRHVNFIASFDYPLLRRQESGRLSHARKPRIQRRSLPWARVTTLSNEDVRQIRYRASTSPDVEMRANHSRDEGPVQVCTSICSLCMCTYAT